ncbi:tripartite tricarboxylate transporter substrate binding protein [Xenophilus sp. Marseille-Q4582]|uniref:Bug family tripartite tricarboxylate transporter substrate binding protein n=1 Tax=Xenophilus sp. Marseille-Q4582 TaxID=2866600 RepID=UPI001CE4B43A|nr:tripartite tricarboxylate transporter substrate binding protein [Xenophilus sp. Marseille-Q4582]
MTLLTRRHAGVLLAFSLATGGAFAQGNAYPNRSVKIVVPFSAASTADNVARSFTDRLGQRFKQPFVIDNKAGAGGTLGVSAVAHAPADGYTLVLTTSSPLVINPLIDRTVNYQVEKDLTPVAMIASGGLLLVAHPNLPANTLPELVALLRKNPGKYSFASNGNGSYSHMAMELFKQMAGVDLVHIAYKGPAQAETDVIGGQVTLMFDSVTTGAEMVKAGRLKAFGISSAQADAVAPQFMPIAQQGVAALKDFDVVGWTGLLAPAGTPPETVATLRAAMRDLIAEPAFRADMLKRNSALVPPEKVGDMALQIRNDRVKWEALVRAADIRLD